MATATVYFNDVVGGVCWFAASVAGWVVCEQCLSVASICQVIGCVLSGHCRELLRSSELTPSQAQLLPYSITVLGGLCPPLFWRMSRLGSLSSCIRWKTHRNVRLNADRLSRCIGVYPRLPCVTNSDSGPERSNGCQCAPCR